MTRLSGLTVSRRAALQTLAAALGTSRLKAADFSPSAFDHMEFWVSDVVASANFYCRLFGADRLKNILGLARMSFHDINHPIAITDVPLEQDIKTAGTGAKQVVVDNFSFAPVMATVATGSTVTWTNRDDVPHNVVSTNQKFKSPVLDTDETFSHTFDSPGTYKYFCSIHPKMTGQVVVA